MQLHEKVIKCVCGVCRNQSDILFCLPTPHAQQQHLPCCHFSARHISLKGRKCNDRCDTDISPQGWLYEPNSSERSGPAAAGPDSASLHSARFKLLWINREVCRPRWLGKRLRRGITKEGSSCVTRLWGSMVWPRGKVKEVFQLCRTTLDMKHKIQPPEQQC